MKKLLCLASASLVLLAQPVFAELVTYTTIPAGSSLELDINGKDVTGFYTMKSSILKRICANVTQENARKAITGTSQGNTVIYSVTYPECNKELTITGTILDGNVFKVTSVR